MTEESFKDTTAILERKRIAGHIHPCAGCKILVGISYTFCGMCESKDKAMKDAKIISDNLLAKIVKPKHRKGWGSGIVKK